MARGYIWPEPNEPAWSGVPLTYDPWAVLVLEKNAREIKKEKQIERRDRLAESLTAPLGIGNKPPTWKRTNAYDFAYAVDYYGQGDGKKKTFFVSCAGRWHLSICKATPKWRELNHIHYNDWLAMPQR